MQGGIASHCKVLAETLHQQGHSVFIFSDERAQSQSKDIPLTNKTARWRRKTLKAVNTWAHQNKLDIVNLHYQTAAFNMSPWIHFLPGYIKDIPVVTTFHDLRFPYLFPKAGMLRTWIVKRLANHSVGVIATNHEDLQQLSHHAFHTLIPIGSSVMAELPQDYSREKWLTQAGIDPAVKNIIVHFGFINHSKGVDTLIESVSQLKNSSTPVHLLMIGDRVGSSDPTNAKYATYIDQLIAKHAIYDRVHWTGFVEPHEVNAYFAASDIIVLPFRDGASFRRSSLMAAITSEQAIITTKPGVEIPEFINGENMMLVSPENSSALSAAIQVAIQSPDLRKKLKEGTRKLKQYFDWEKIAQENVDFFCHIIEGPPS